MHRRTSAVALVGALAWTLVCAHAAVAAPLAGAVPVPPESVRVVTLIDSSRVLTVHGDSLETRAARDTTTRHVAPPLRWSEQPRFVMMRSAVFPGWGQWHNHAPVKAVVIGGTEVALVVLTLQDHSALSGLERQVAQAQAANDADAYAAAVNRYNDRLGSYTARQWLIGGALLYALIDAYVDANFRGFDVEFRNDPALPEGPPADVSPPKKGGHVPASGVRAAIRWHF